MSVTAVAYASQTLTSDATNVTANDTVTIAGVVYTFKASVTTTANEVKVGADAAASLANLKAAINASDTTVHGSATEVNPHVVATTLTSTTLKVVAKVPGLIGNFLTTTEASTHLSWGAATLAGGTGSLSTRIADIAAMTGNSAIKQLLLNMDANASSD